ncbi:MAG: ABC-F family ATP-binding cassette domain-containing protein [Clostridiales bacterium]|nr:ABC-F family ATP-binding cassette domain-containing protein [Clostridiales bacterium]
MAILTAQNLTMGFSDKLLFDGASFEIGANDRVGLVGANGVGKTTLFKLILNELLPSGGGIARARELRIGYMEQYSCEDSARSVYDEALLAFADVIKIEDELEEIRVKLERLGADDTLISRQAYLTDEFTRREGLTFRARTRSALIGLGFSEAELSLPVGAISGGQNSKLNLCKLLLSDSSLMLLDEPTNHLDIDSVRWLEDFLSKYRGAFIIISHDRYFLDRATNRTMEIEHGHISVTDGGYSRHLELKAERQIFIEREYEKASAEIKRIEGIIEQQKRFNRERNYITIASKQKQIDRIKQTLVVPERENAALKFTFSAKVVSGNEVLEVSSLAKIFDGRTLFRNADMLIERGERVFLLGSNGVGKSTLLKIINRKLRQDDGSFRLGAGVKIGYFDQTISNLNDSNTVLDEIWNAYRSMTETEVRKALAVFLFKGDSVYKKVGELSGGERARTALLKIMLSGANFLVLDEPTNHLDISSREALENALLGYDGTLLAVSHDRYFINKLASRIIFLSENGTETFPGNYDYYFERQSQREKPSEREKEEKKPNDYKLRKELESRERKRRTQMAKTENDIEALETGISEITEKLSEPETAADYETVLTLTEELTRKKQELDALYSLWEELAAE